MQELGGLASAAAEVEDAHAGRDARPTRLLLDGPRVGLDVEAQGLLFALHEVEGALHGTISSRGIGPLSTLAVALASFRVLAGRHPYVGPRGQARHQRHLA